MKTGKSFISFIVGLVLTISVLMVTGTSFASGFFEFKWPAGQMHTN